MSLRLARPALTIEVLLPADRRGVGDLVLLGGALGELMSRMPCLGKADNERAADKGNAGRDPCHPYGDTPLGRYRPARLIQVGPGGARRLGAWFLPLEGIEGDALLAARNGRTGLGIHGGRGDRLVPTYGCLRLRDRDMAALAQHVSGCDVQVVIRELV